MRPSGPTLTARASSCVTPTGTRTIPDAPKDGSSAPEASRAPIVIVRAYGSLGATSGNATKKPSSAPATAAHAGVKGLGEISTLPPSPKLVTRTPLGSKSVARCPPTTSRRPSVRAHAPIPAASSTSSVPPLPNVASAAPVASKRRKAFGSQEETRLAPAADTESVRPSTSSQRRPALAKLGSRSPLGSRRRSTLSKPPWVVRASSTRRSSPSDASPRSSKPLGRCVRTST